MSGQWPGTLLIIGCGNMGGAMLAGWLAGGLAPQRLIVVDPMLAEAPDGVRLLREVPDDPPDAILLGIKPQMFDEVAKQVRPIAGPGTVIMSILAGVELDSLSAAFPDAAGFVRIMPNLAAALGKSPVALATNDLPDARKAQVASLMQPLGTAEWIAETQFDLVTALVGSGPAFVYRFIDALASGAVSLGLDPAQAESLALAMVEGASLLASRSDAAPGELARRVASPGGTTEAGLKILDEHSALSQIVARTLLAARDRGAQLAEEARKQG